MITIDAQNKKLGRLASEVAELLMGKDLPENRPNAIPDRKIKIDNLSKLAIDPGKNKETFIHYTGYPGGLRTQTLKELAEKKGYSEVFKKAVYGMLPGNKLRPLMMKNLILEE